MLSAHILAQYPNFVITEHHVYKSLAQKVIQSSLHPLSILTTDLLLISPCYHSISFSVFQSKKQFTSCTDVKTCHNNSAVWKLYTMSTSKQLHTL